MDRSRSSVSGEVARRYHEATKHSPESVRRIRYALDWDNQPEPFKSYPELPRVDLPRLPAAPPVPALEAIASLPPDEPGAPDAASLAAVLRWGAGVTRTRRFAGGTTFHFRTYACAGALYPVELYLACGELAGLAAGAYHFDPSAINLTRLREGDQRPYLARATASESAVAHTPAVLILTGIPWRTAWKYRDRGYRHLFWDAGMMLANVLALAAAYGLVARVVLGFSDDEVSRILGIDGHREFPLCLVALGAADAVAPAPSPPEPIAPFSPSLSPVEREFPLITETNDAGKLRTETEVRRWRERPRKDAGAEGPREVESRLQGTGGPQPRPRALLKRAATLRVDREGVGASARGGGRDDIVSVIRRRGSARDFGPRPMPVDVLRDVLDRALVGVPTDLAPQGQRLVEMCLIANAVEGLASGAYAYDGVFALLRKGSFRREAGLLCLEQPLGAHAAATHFLMTDIDRALEVLGDRGYRAAQLEGGIVAGRMYLGAYAHHFGATGLTFYDEEVTRFFVAGRAGREAPLAGHDDMVTEFFSPRARGRGCLIVMALGESIRPLR